MSALSLLPKIKHHDGRFYTAMLLPREVFVLANANCKFSKDDLAFAQKCGEDSNYVRRYYFTLSNVLHKAWRKV